MNAHEREALADASPRAFDAPTQTEVIVYEQRRGADALHARSGRIRTSTAETPSCACARSSADAPASPTTNVLDDRVARRVRRTRARHCAAFAPEDPMFAALAGTAKPTRPAAGAYVAGTAAAGPQERARRRRRDLRHRARATGCWSAGYAATRTTGITIANSAGVRAAFDGDRPPRATSSSVRPIPPALPSASAPTSATSTAARSRESRPQKARASAGPVTVEPGDWTVILEPAAFGELMSYLLVHFSAQRFDEGSSFCSAGLDRSYAGDNVTMVDDAHHPLHAGHAVRLRRDAQAARAAARCRHRSRDRDRPPLGRQARPPEHRPRAARARTPTGRKRCTPSSKPGTKSTEQLIAETERGLLVTRFWYIRTVDGARRSSPA